MHLKCIIFLLILNVVNYWSYLAANRNSQWCCSHLFSW